MHRQRRFWVVQVYEFVDSRGKIGMPLGGGRWWWFTFTFCRVGIVEKRLVEDGAARGIEAGSSGEGTAAG